VNITFNLYSGAGLESTNTLNLEDFIQFRKIAEEFKQTIKIKSVK
jgi:hypothetical protein